MKGVTLTKWGNGQGIRIPQTILQMLNIGIGDQLRMEVKDDKITLTPCKTKKKRFSYAEVLADYPDGVKVEYLGPGMRVGKENYEG